MTYGERLGNAMMAMKKTRKELAVALGCTPQSIGMVLTGAGKSERFLSVQKHAAAARFLRVDSYWLATGNGAMVVGAGDLKKAPALLSDDAAEIAAFFDKLNQLDRTRAYVTTMHEFFKIADERAKLDVQSIPVSNATVNLKKP